jgi:hypothetical protein
MTLRYIGWQPSGGETFCIFLVSLVMLEFDSKDFLKERE